MQSIGLREALNIPGMLAFAFSFFCVKFGVYSYLLWLPTFLDHEFGFSKFETANMLSVFEVGTLFGGFSLGFLSDLMYARRSPVGAVAVLISFCLSMTLTLQYKDMSQIALSFILFFLGLMLGGLHHILCVTCSADLGQQESLINNKKATATVTGLIDGMGSLGTAVGQLVVGATADSLGWKYGYLMIISVVILSTLIPLSSILIKDINFIRQKLKERGSNAKEADPTHDDRIRH